MLCAANIAGFWVFCTLPVLCLCVASANPLCWCAPDYGGWLSAWRAKHYFKHAFDADPVMAYCAQNVVPICWSDLVLEPASKSERMVLKAATFGLLFTSGRASADAHPGCGGYEVKLVLIERTRKSTIFALSEAAKSITR